MLCCGAFVLAVSSSGTVLSLDLYPRCFLVIVSNFFIPSVQKGDHFFISPYFDFRLSMYHSLILSCLFVCLLVVFFPKQRESTLKREIFILFITVPMTCHIEGAQYIFLNE